MKRDEKEIFAEKYFEQHKEEIEKTLNSNGYFLQDQFGPGPTSNGLSYLAELINTEFNYDDDNQVFFFEMEELDWSGIFIQLGKFEDTSLEEFMRNLTKIM